MAEAAEPILEDTFEDEFEAMRDEPEERFDDAPQEATVEPVEPVPVADDPVRRELRSLKAALREERKARQALEQQRGTESPSSTFQAMLDGAPDENVDPIGFMNHMRQRLAELDAQHRADAQREQAQMTQNQQVQQIVRSMQEYEQDFTGDHPDYPQAVEHFKNARMAEFQDQGLTGQQLNAALAQDLLGLAQRCMAVGKDPAEVVYSLAKRVGYAPKAQPASVKTVTAVDPNAQRLQQLEAGQRQARSLGAGGSQDGGVLSYGDVAKLNGAAFDAAFDKLKQQERRRRA